MRKLKEAAALIRDRVLESIAQALAGLQAHGVDLSRGNAGFGVNRRVLLPDGNFDFGANPEDVSYPDVRY